MFRIMFTLTLVVAAFALAACGDDDEPSGSPPPGATATTQAPAPAEADVRIATDPSGRLAFETNRLTAEAGKVTFEFTNDAQVGHDFVIEQDGEKVDGTEVITASSATLETQLRAGRYAFYCSVPGHRDAGMEGTLTVR